MSEIQEQYEEVVRRFFPQWTAAKEWKLGDCLTATWDHSFVDKDGCIWLSRDVLSAGDTVVQAAIIHGICHAKKTHPHGTGWTDEMERKVRRAERLGEPDLAEALRAEICLHTHSSEYAQRRWLAHHVVTLSEKLPGWTDAAVLEPLRQKAQLDHHPPVDMVKDSDVWPLVEQLRAEGSHT